MYHGDVFPGEYAVIAGSAFPLDVETVLSCGWISSYGRWRSSEVLEQDPILYGTKKMFSEIAGNADTEICLQNIMQDLSRI